MQETLNQVKHCRFDVYIHRCFRRDTIIFQDLPYTDCIATGWGKSATSGDLTDILLQTKVPIHTNVKYVYNNLIAILQSYTKSIYDFPFVFVFLPIGNLF